MDIFVGKFLKIGRFIAIFFLMGPHYVDFTFAFDTTLIRLEMTEIWPKYVAQAFLPPPWIGLKYLEIKIEK